MDLDGTIDDPLSRFGREELGGSRLASDASAGDISGPRGPIHQQPGGIELGGHVGECRLRELKICEPRAELPA
ncbi:hypothetical protein D3C83_243050 [compost metagenome]